jgi:hypothetical protein
MAEESCVGVVPKRRLFRLLGQIWSLQLNRVLNVEVGQIKAPKWARSRLSRAFGARGAPVRCLEIIGEICNDKSVGTMVLSRQTLIFKYLRRSLSVLTN